MFSMFLAIELVLLLTPLGYIRTPALSITLMHIPVIACGILMGPGYGAALGLVFGLTSIWNATTAPGPASFIFSPFVTIGTISGNWSSLLIALVPRILLGYLAGVFFNFFSKKMNRPVAALVTGILATLCHTLMVLGLIAIFWGPQYAELNGVAENMLLKMNRPVAALVTGILATLCHTLMVLGLIAIFWGPQYAELNGVAENMLLIYLGTVILTNGLAEMGAAGVICMALTKAIRPSMLPNTAKTAKA